MKYVKRQEENSILHFLYPILHISWNNLYNKEEDIYKLKINNEISFLMFHMAQMADII